MYYYKIFVKKVTILVALKINDKTSLTTNLHKSIYVIKIILMCYLVMDPWLNEYERLNQEASEISADIKDVSAAARVSAGGAAQVLLPPPPS